MRVHETAKWLRYTASMHSTWCAIQAVFHGALLAISWLALAVLAGESPEGWYRDGEALVAERRQRAGSATARNLILFVGDGMSLATVAAARIMDGQLRGRTGEENFLDFEHFEQTALAKTYTTDRQVPDSAGTMTAMVTGVKSFTGSIAVDQAGRFDDCEASRGRERVSLLDLAKLAGMATGIVTTTRITHATPAALYAKSPNRRWETDAGIPATSRQAGCRDIAMQLVEYKLGGGIDVVLGGGRRAFMTLDQADPEYPELRGHRADGRDLIAEWQRRNPEGRYVWNLAQFKQLDAGRPLLGLFEPSHMQYEHDRSLDPAGEPSLSEMTRTAVRILEQSGDRGFFLMVEGGRIDHAHHVNNAHRALTDTIEFARAVHVARTLTDPADTLIFFTADHGHALVFAGYPARGNPITGSVRQGPGHDEDAHAGNYAIGEQPGPPLTALRYHDGPGFRLVGWPDSGPIDPRDPDFRQASGLWRSASTHSGEDVPVYATGPGAEVLRGVLEQHVIFHVLVQARPELFELTQALKDEFGLPDWRRAQGLRSSATGCALAQLMTIGECGWPSRQPRNAGILGPEGIQPQPGVVR